MNFFTGLFRDGYSLALGSLVFLTAAILAFSIMAVVRVRASVKRRAARIVEQQGRPASTARSLRYSSLKAVGKLLEYTSKHYATTNGENMKVLRQRLVQAGIYDPRAVAYFFVGRTALAIGVAILVFLFLPMFTARGGAFLWTIVVVGGVLGYIGPSLYTDRRIKQRKLEHRAGFPDFMDLLVVCADSGLSMEASLERVGSELGDSYPSLAANIHMTNLEIRAGRTLDRKSVV